MRSAKVYDGRLSGSLGWILLAFQAIALMIVTCFVVSLWSGYIHIIGGGAAPPDSPPPPHYYSPESILPNHIGADDSSVFSILMDHPKDSDEVSKEEATLLRELFDEFDSDQDTRLSYSEFSQYVTQTLRTAQTFDFINVRQDGGMRYDEFVSVLQSMDIHAPQLTNALTSLYGSDYNVNDEAELLAQTVFFAFDYDKSGFITREELNDGEIKTQWRRYGDKPRDLYIDFPEFKDAFFKNPTFKMMQILDEQKENGDFDANAIFTAVQTRDIDTFRATLKYECHSFDQRFESERRRLTHYKNDVFSEDFYIHVGTEIVAVSGAVLDAAIAGGEAIYNAAGDVVDAAGDVVEDVASCYYDGNMVDVFGSGPKLLKDVEIGEYVYDGNDYSKIFFIQKYNKFVPMIDIKYGIRSDNNSIILTAAHLIYQKDSKSPIRSGEIEIYDVLEGNSVENYTVYDMSIFYGNPISPITMSGNLIVNGIKTSVYSHSVQESIRLQNGGAIFRWMSDNVNEDLAANCVDFYYNVIYKQLMNQRFFELVTDNEMTAIFYVLSIPIFFVFIATQVWNHRSFGVTKLKKV